MNNKEQIKNEIVGKIYDHINKFSAVKGYIDKYPTYLYLGSLQYEDVHDYNMVMFREDNGDEYILGCKLIPVELESFVEVG